MILATLIGIVLQTWAGVAEAGTFGFLLGIVVALFIPTGKGGCAVPASRDER